MESFLELCENIATADVDLFSFFLKKGVDPNIFDEVSSAVVMIVAVNTLLIICSVVSILCSMPLTTADRTWWSC